VARAAKWTALCAGAAWLWDRPTEAMSILVAVLIGGPAFWFGLGPGWSKLKFHPNKAVRLLSWVASLAVILFTMKKVVPFVEAYLAAAV
jgi:hypothetical protein